MPESKDTVAAVGIGKNHRLDVSVGKTINLGNYESVKLHVGLSMEIDNSLDLVGVNEAYTDIMMEVGEQLDNLVEEYRS